MEKSRKESNELSSTTRPRSVVGSSLQLKLLFSGLQDLTDTWGKLHFTVTPVRLMDKNEWWASAGGLHWERAA